MSKPQPKNLQKTARGVAEPEPQSPRSLSLASKGIKTGNDFANFMSAVMSDLIEGRLSPAVGNATCNAGGKLLKAVEMQYRYGKPGLGGTPKVLQLTGESGEE